jgi:RNA polymerase sigma-70 factor (ECF subfamily)
VELRPDSSLLAESALSMSRVSRDLVSAEAAEATRLVRAALAGDSAAFETLVLRHEARVMNIAARLLGARDEAADAAQEVFLRAFKYLHRLDIQKPVEPWLVRITVNVCRDALRMRQRRRDTFVVVERAEPVDESADQHLDVSRKQERLILQRALGTLPEKERLAIVLRDIEGLSTAEVASILRSSETTVRSQVSRGRLRLRAAIHRLTGAES